MYILLSVAVLQSTIEKRRKKKHFHIIHVRVLVLQVTVGKYVQPEINECVMIAAGRLACQ